MARPLRMPQPGQMTEECTVLNWYKAVGDTIAKGDELYEIETDKSNMDVEAFDTGTLLAIVVAEGETVPVDAVVAWIGEPGESVPAEEASPAPPETKAEAPVVMSETKADDGRASAPDSGTTAIEPASAGSAPDVADPRGDTPAEGGRRVAVSPRAARVAIELGVDPGRVTGSGPGGRIVERDVRAAAAAGVTSAPPPSPSAAPQPSAEPPPSAASQPSAAALASAAAPEPLSRLRKIIARRLTESTLSVPSFTISAAIDMTDLVALRADLKAAGSKISITDLVHAAVIASLVEHPLVNSITDGQQLWRREAVHLGIAVSITDGLLVPVIRDAQALDLAGLSSRTRKVVAAARDGKLGPDELSGSTFTVSNMGMYGVDAFSAIINPGESGILAVSASKPQVVASAHGIVTRSLMNVTLTADHRLVDGELGARFVESIRAKLEDASSFDVGAVNGRD